LKSSLYISSRFPFLHDKQTESSLSLTVEYITVISTLGRSVKPKSRSIFHTHITFHQTQVSKSETTDLSIS
jgi:hypothetical protein